MIRQLTDSKNPIIVRRRRFVSFFLIGTGTAVAMAIALGFLGAVGIAMPVSAIFGFFMATKAPPFFMMGLAVVASVLIWASQYFAGYFYIGLVSRLGGENRKEVLTPLFLSSLALWLLVAGMVVTTSGINFGCCAVVAGIALNVLGQRQKMMALRKALPYVQPAPKIESSGNFLDHLYGLKEAENIEHLEQLSKQCLLTIKPSAAGSNDCTSALINELMKRKLSVEADELSSLQLKLIDRSEG